MRKTLKLSITLVLACLMLFSVAIIASAETEPTASGACGNTPTGLSDNVIWEYYADTKTLVISGTGWMQSFESQAAAPWHKYRSVVENLIIEEGVTSIGKSAFTAFTKLTEVVIPDSVDTINPYAFMACTSLAKVHFGTGVKSVAKDAFNNTLNIRYLSAGSLASWCQIEFANGTANPLGRMSSSYRDLYVDGVAVKSLVIPAEVEKIGAYTFYNSRITSVTFNDNVKEIGRGAFTQCNSVTTMTFNNCSPKTGSMTFNQMNRLTDVYVNNLAAWSKSNFSTTGNVLRTVIDSRAKYFGIIVDGVKLVITPNSSNKAPESTTLTFPENTTTLANNVFYGRKNVKSVVIPSSVTSINGDTSGSRNKGAFTGAGVTTVYGETGTYAETYAKNNKYAFVAINPVDVTGITLNKSAEELTIGSSLTLTATVAPADATYKNIIWTSSNEDVARVSGAAGKILAVSAGTATITAKTSNGAYSATCVITVPAIDVTDFSIDKAEATLKAGHTLKILPTFTPANASNKNIVWTSSNNSVATVANGVVKAVANGTVTITATTVDGGFVAECTVEVYGFVEEPTVIPVTGVTLNTTGAVLEIGEKLTLKATVNPADATDASVTWASDAEGVATVANGVVTAVGAGTANITVTTTDGGFKATCTVVVNKAVVPVTGVTLDTPAAELEIGGTITLTATVNPADATDATVTWASDAEGVATVVDGVVTAVAAGTANITVTTTDGGFTATCVVTVNPEEEEEVDYIESIVFNSDAVTLVVGDTFELIGELIPANTMYKVVYWDNSKPSVAEIDVEVGEEVYETSCTITAKAVGTTIIALVCLENEDVYAECTVSVVSGYPVEGIALNKTSASMNVGDVDTLTVNFTPANATNKAVTWTSSDDNVITVVDGVVTAVGNGVATITATSADGGFTATCKYIITVGNETPPIQW